MKKMLLTAAFLAVMAGVAAAKDDNPPLLCNIPLPAPAPTPDCAPPPPAPVAAPAVCAPPPPVCPTPDVRVVSTPIPSPVCPPEPTVCPTPAPAPAAMAAARPAPTPQYRLVPVKKKIYEEEEYVVQETRTQVHDEVHTRIVRPPSPRLARVVRNNDVALVLDKREPKVVPYVKKVKTSYTVPVTKTRKVAREIEEVKIVEERRWFR